MESPLGWLANLTPSTDTTYFPSEAPCTVCTVARLPPTLPVSMGFTGGPCLGQQTALRPGRAGRYVAPICREANYPLLCPACGTRGPVANGCRTDAVDSDPGAPLGPLLLYHAQRWNGG